ncbi:MAG: DUF4232 domain-containing protein [Gaiellaceae bacterium]
MRRAVVVALGVVLLASGCSLTRTSTKTLTVTVTNEVTSTVTTTAPAQGNACTGRDLQGSFDVQPGSAGAGQITYVLKLVNSSSSTCLLSGAPLLELFDKAGAALPTHAALEPGKALADVLLQPGASTSIDARFSPDVPGQGEQQAGPCEKTAATLRVTPAGGGTTDAAIAPPTPVCEQGTLSLSAG